MKLLSDLEDEELVALADADFQESVQSEARTLVPDALNTYATVMNSSDDDNARVKAADKIISLAGFQEKQNATLPSGVSEEVFKLALAGLGQLAGIAASSHATDAILRNVTPAKTDPRMLVDIETKHAVDDSPLNTSPKNSDNNDNDEIVNLISKERYEIINRQEN